MAMQHLNLEEQIIAHDLWDELMAASSLEQIEAARTKLENTRPNVQIEVNRAIADFWIEGRKDADVENPFPSR